MANTFSQCFYHYVFSTKERVKFIYPEIEDRVWAYIGGIANHKMTAVQVGGIDDHIHALMMAKPSWAPSEIAQLLKGESSKWIHEEFPKLSKFGWHGYAVFTVSKSIVPKVVDYIQDQRVHHSTKTFEEEYVELIELHGVEYDERFLFG
jgi:putative transposase